MKKTKDGEELTRLTGHWEGSEGEVYLWVTDDGRVREVEETEEAKEATIGGPFAWIMDRIFPKEDLVH